MSDDIQRGSKRHCFPTVSPAEAYESGYIQGAHHQAIKDKIMIGCLAIAEQALATIYQLEPKSDDPSTIRKWDRETAKQAIDHIAKLKTDLSD